MALRTFEYSWEPCREHHAVCGQCSGGLRDTFIQSAAMASAEALGAVTPDKKGQLPQVANTHSRFKGDRRGQDKMINPAPGFWTIFGPWGPTAGPGSPGNGPGSRNSAGCTKNQTRRPILSPIRGHFVFLGPTAKG